MCIKVYVYDSYVQQQQQLQQQQHNNNNNVSHYYGKDNTIQYKLKLLQL